MRQPGRCATDYKFARRSACAPPPTRRSSRLLLIILKNNFINVTKSVVQIKQWRVELKSNLPHPTIIQSVDLMTKPTTFRIINISKKVATIIPLFYLPCYRVHSKLLGPLQPSPNKCKDNSSFYIATNLITVHDKMAGPLAISSAS